MIKKPLNSWLRERSAALRVLASAASLNVRVAHISLRRSLRFRFFAYLIDMSRSLRAARLASHPARTSLQRLLGLTIALAAAGVVSGCSMAPKYVRPDAPVATVYPAQTDAKPQAKPAVQLAWQEFFRDARLKTLIAAALENNRDFRIVALRVEEARALYGIQKADLLPNLELRALGTRTGLPEDVSPIRGTSSRYDVGLYLASYELDFFGRVRSLSDAALASYLATEEAQRSAQISLIAEVAKAHLSERAFAEQFVLAQRAFESRRTSYELAQKRFEVGATSALDLRQFETLMHSARAAMLALARQRAQAENAVALLVGKPLASLQLPPAQPLSDQGVLIDIPAGLPSDLLENRPDIRQFEQRLKSANANIGAARAAFFPRISLTASRGTASTAMSGLFDAGSGAWAFAPQLVLPIFDAGRNMANLDLSEARKNIAVAEYEKTIQTAFREVADALVARNLLNEQVDAQTAFLVAESERLKLSQARYDNGIASSLDVLDSERQLFAAEQTLVQARLLRLTNAIDLYRSLGGGWKAEAAPQEPKQAKAVNAAPA